MNKTMIALMLVFFLAVLGFGIRVVFNTQFRAARASAIIPATCDIVPASVNKKCLPTEQNGCVVPVAAVVQSATGEAVGGAMVKLTSSLGEVSPMTQSTDASGVANFTLTSTTAGIAVINGLLTDASVKCSTATVAFIFGN